MRKITDKMLYQYYPEIADKIAEQYPEKPELNRSEYSSSEQFKERIESSISKEKKVSSGRRQPSVRWRAIAAVLAIVIGLGAVSQVSPTAREKFFDLTIKKIGKYDDINYHNVRTGQEEYATLKWIPSGYKLSEKDSSQEDYTLVYKDDSGHEIVFLQWAFDDSTGAMANNEYDKRYHLYLNGDDIIISYDAKVDSWGAHWYHRNVYCVLSGNEGGISEFQLLRMLRKLEYAGDQ